MLYKLSCLFFQTLVLLFVASVPLKSQIDLNSAEPGEITVCGNSLNYEIEIINNGTNNLPNPELSVKFPEGVVYEAGSLTGLGATEADISNLNLPIFDISTLAQGRSVKFNINIKANCESLTGNAVFTNEYTLTVSGNSQSFESEPYNILIPSITVSNPVNDDYIGPVRDVFMRNFTVSNTGFGSVDSVLIEDIFPSGLMINDVSVGTFSLTGNHSRTWITAADFQLIGNGDDVFDSGEEFVFSEEVEILNCEVGSSQLSVSWGCGGNTCKDFLFSADVSVDGEPPSLEADFAAVQYADFCNEGVVNMFVENTAPGNSTSSTAAFNIVLEPGFGLKTTPEILSRNSCYPLTSFSINGTPLTFDTVNYTGYGFDLSQLLSDPDGPGGLDDLDGDGQFDDLPDGERISFQYTTNFDINCLDCEEAGLPQLAFRLAQHYSDECGAEFFDLENSDRYSQGIGLSTVNENLEFEYFAGDTVLVNIDFNRSMRSFLNSCRNPESTIELIIPRAFEFADFTQPTFEGLPINYNLINDTLTLDFDNFPTGNLELNFTVLCDTSLLGQSIECQIAGTPPSINTIEYTVEYSCPDSGCNDPVTVFCGSSSPFFASCNKGTNSGGDFVNIVDFKAERTTLGWKDTTLNELVSPTDPSLELTTGTSYDIVKFDVTGTVFGTGNFNSSILQIFHFPKKNEALFSYLREEITFFDVETGQTITCSDTATNITSEELYLGLYSTDFDLSKYFSGGCLDGFNFTSGDSLKYSIYVRLENNPLPNKLAKISGLSAGFKFDDGVEELICSKKSFNFNVVKALSTFTLNTSSNFKDCGVVSVSANLVQGAGSSVETDPFPNEIRPVSRFDSLIFKLPIGINYANSTSRIVYEYADVNGLTSTGEFRLPDPEIYQADSSVYLKYTNVNYPVVDFFKAKTRNELTFEINPDCRFINNYDMDADAFYKLYTYPSHLTEPINKESSKNKNLRSSYSRRKLNLSNQTYAKDIERISWDVEICNDDNISSGFAIPNNWIAAEVVGSNLSIVSLSDITDPVSPTPIPLTGYGSGNNKWGKIGDLSGPGCRTFKLTAEYRDCILDSLFIKTGFDCAGYPVDPLTGYETPAPVGSFPSFYSCEKNLKEKSVTLIPRNPEFQFELIEEPNNLTSLCEPLTYEVRILNTQTGPAFDMNIELALPPGTGMEIIPGSTQFKYPADEPFRPGTDPVNNPGTNEYKWDLSQFDPAFAIQGLSGTFKKPLNEIVLRFQLNTTCDFLQGVSPIVSVSGKGVCAGDIISSTFSLPALNFAGVNFENRYNLDLVSGKVNPCDDTGTMTIELKNAGNRVSGAGQTLQLTIPGELNYVPGTMNGIQNIANTEPDISFFNNTQILQWDIPTGLQRNESAEFSIAYQSAGTNKLSCGISEAKLQTTQEIPLLCPSVPMGTCSINIINEEANFKLEIVYPEPDLINANAISFPANDSMEMVRIDYNLLNQSPDVLFDTAAMVEIFADTDGNGVFDNNSDNFLEKFNTPDVILQPGSSIDTSFSTLLPGSELCGIFLVLDDAANSCICGSDTIYIPMIPIKNTIADDTLCFGKTINLGNPPLIGHQYDWQPADLFPNTVSNPNFTFQGTFPTDNSITQTFTLTTTRAAGCSVTDSVKITSYQNPGELAVSDYNGSNISCFGADDAFINATVDAIQPIVDTTWNNGLTTAFIDNLGPGNYSVTFTDIQGCKTEKSISVSEPDSLGNNIIQSDFQGFGIRCFNEDSGFAEANTFGGTGNYSYTWSTGADSSQLQNLMAGIYSVTVTDENNCSDERTIELIQPEEISALAETVGSPCFGEENGVIEVVDVSPVGNYSFSLNCQNYTDSPLFFNLAEGSYNVCIRDERGCIEEEVFVVDSAQELLLDVSNDTTIFAGGSVQLSAQTNYPVDQIIWEPPLDLSCSECPNPIATPEITQFYQVTAIDNNGCTAKERVTVRIDKTGRIFVPTAFSPNNDGYNDLIQVYTGPEVAKVISFNIYSRWGEKVFEAKDYDPRNTSIGWDGIFRGKPMNSNTFTYYLQVEIGDGNIISQNGEFKLIRK